MKKIFFFSSLVLLSLGAVSFAKIDMGMSPDMSDIYTPVSASFLLLETGDKLLIETGDKLILE